MAEPHACGVDGPHGVDVDLFEVETCVLRVVFETAVRFTSPALVAAARIRGSDCSSSKSKGENIVASLSGTSRPSAEHWRPSGWRVNRHCLPTRSRGRRGAAATVAMVSPSDLAVLTLIASSNDVGCSTGKSAGLTPWPGLRAPVPVCIPPTWDWPRVREPPPGTSEAPLLRAVAATWPRSPTRVPRSR
jgi:hypothetical protein